MYFLEDKVKDANFSATIYRALAQNRLQNSAILSNSGLYSLALKGALKAMTGTHIKERTVSICVCVCLCVEVSVCEVQRNAWKEFTAERLPYYHLQTASGLHNQEATQTSSSVPFTTGCEVWSLTLSEAQSSTAFQNIITSALFGSKSVEVKKRNSKYWNILSTFSAISFGPTKCAVILN
jgi:hypothetical protein